MMTSSGNNAAELLELLLMSDRRPLGHAATADRHAADYFRRWKGWGLCILLISQSGKVSADDLQVGSAVLAKLFGERIVATNVHAVRTQAAALPADQRFEFLRDAIMPATEAGTIHMGGEFSQTDPVPVLPGAEAAASGEIVSPVFDLLDAAQEVGRLDELLARVMSLPESADEYQRRAQCSLRLLVLLEMGDRDAAKAAADNLFSLVADSTSTSLADMWPETLAVYRAVRSHRADRMISDLLTTIAMRPSHVPGAELGLWQAHLSALTQTLLARISDTGLQPLEGLQQAELWHPVSRAVSRSRGVGYPQAVWMGTDRELRHISGHQLDALLYRSPLRGNYEVEADLYGSGITQFMVAGRILGMSAAGQGIVVGSFQNGTDIQPVEPHWGISNPWVRYRAVVRDGTLTISLDGRPVHTESLPAHHAPWIGVHTVAHGSARIRDIRITGNPEVPAAVTLSEAAGLQGWVSYYDETINDLEGDWRWEADTQSGTGQIIAGRKNSLDGSYPESLLRYQRPLLEDGSVTYEFFFVPGRTEAHPALDRLGFLLRPDGVQEHWITDGQYDTSSIGPENAFERPECRRGPVRLPLRSEAWNRLEVSLVGERTQLKLNGVLVYERDLEPANRRTFGLFRYADRDLRVRSVVMRGDWPMTIPPTADQPYADPAIAAVDAGLAGLTERFDHDFSQDGLPERSFRRPAGKAVPQASSQGVIHSERARDEGWAYSVIQPMVEMHGDFDVMLRFEDLQTPSVNSGCGLGLFVGDKHLELIRRDGQPRVKRVLATFVTPMPGGVRHDGRDLTTEALAGTFRIVRRGDTVSALFADNDSTAFRLLSEHTWENCGELPATLDIRAMAHDRGRVQVTWSRFQVAAQRLMRIPSGPEVSKPVVFTINSDGSELKQLTQPMPEFVWHGSPEWSPDGKRIAFDAWTGNANTSHIYIMNDDGTQLVDLGVGIIPTFSPDGTRLAFTWGGHGTTIMNVDGSEREVLTPDGWGTQWSPDGRWIAYASYGQLPEGGAAANLTVIDVTTREKRALLIGEQAGRYTQIEWNMAWAPDSRRIVFKGHRRGGAEVAIVSIDGSMTDFRVLTSENISGNLGWHPDGSRILLSKAGKLHEYELETQQMQQLPGHPPEPANPGGVWDMAGERIVFIAVPKPEPQPWKD